MKYSEEEHHPGNLIMKKHQRDPRWGTVLQNNWPVLFQNVKINRHKDCHERHVTTNAICDSGFDPGKAKQIAMKDSIVKIN